MKLAGRTVTAAEFFRPKNVGDRPWGYEDLLALIPGVATLKLLQIDAGHKGRLQRHHKKDEAGYVLRGVLRVRWVDDTGLGDPYIRERDLLIGDSFRFPAGCIHQEEAVSDCTIIEISTPYGNDREGMEERFGLPVPEGALPSTTPDEVTIWEKWW